MPENRLICLGRTQAISCAVNCLRASGWEVKTNPDWSAKRILLDVPSFGPGRSAVQDTLFASLPPDTIIYGGNLNHPTFERLHTVDFLKDEIYLAKNAAITAHCAMQIGSSQTEYTYFQLPVLVIGWGRIGKCLADLLKNAGAKVAVAVRRKSDLAILQALGFTAIDITRLQEHLHSFRIVFNTVPSMILDEPESALLLDCLKIDLASQRGISGEDVIWARGLPGQYAPKSSGALIAKTFLRHIKEESK